MATDSRESGDRPGRVRRPGRWRRRLLLAAALVMLVAVAPFLAWGPALRFDAAAWRETELSGMGVPRGWSNTRARMLDDLLANHLRPGMSRAEVDVLLGRPHEAGELLSGSSGGVSATGWYYHLLWAPRLDQQLVAWCKWRSVDPMLEVSLVDGKLAGAAVLP